VDVPPNKLFVCCGCVVLSDPKDKLGWFDDWPNISILNVL
jgi:hypothetical protein